MILLALIGIISGALTLALLMPYGSIVALAGAPFGASAMVLVASTVMALRRSERVAEVETDKSFVGVAGLELE